MVKLVLIGLVELLAKVSQVLVVRFKICRTTGEVTGAKDVLPVQVTVNGAPGVIVDLNIMIVNSLLPLVAT